ncbi:MULTISPECIES: DUF6802 family protein [Actinoalloteichus]|uniref:DUF6802 domain-containing protein n=1 Tax=Actinoalloteichus fjordicus TaxID=1612552 RepID=A0AAC9PUR0_9PSEU|nr:MULTISPECIES: DUF6802 family protein [Actinoalloteichus]APU17959.1 hypothetical protein UA74_29840 [Actinoalloteichus fjordicus]APU24038.1 hypothetical protein UA75_30375 [Actinoalloteichus sp. GBA129-24]
MYIEDADGSADTTATADTDLKVTVDGEEYTAEANYDMNGDGINDSVVIESDEGYAVFSDVDGDGDADLLVKLDENGDVTSAAGYDEAAGDWVGTDVEDAIGGSGTGVPTDGQDDYSRTGDDVDVTADGAPMIVETPSGGVEAGPPTEDLDGDGVLDTAVVTGDDGTILVVSDVDGDGEADMIGEFGADGRVVVSEHVGDGEWIITESGRLDAEGNFVPDEGFDTDGGSGIDLGGEPDGRGGSFSSAASDDAAWADDAWADDDDDDTGAADRRSYDVSAIFSQPAADAGADAQAQWG